MYIGGVDARGFHHLLWEIVDNSVDEAIAGFGTELSITLLADGGVTIRDNGRGIPVSARRRARKRACQVRAPCRRREATLTYLLAGLAVESVEQGVGFVKSLPVLS